MMRSFFKALLTAAALGCALAAGPEDSNFIRLISPKQRIQECIVSGEYDRASKLIERELAHSFDDPDFLYNAACVAARLGQDDLAADRLLQSVKAGFRRFSVIRRDPDLAALRHHPKYRAVLAARDAADEVLAQVNLQNWQKRLDGKGYTVFSDSAREINYITRLTLTEFAAMHEHVNAHVNCLEAELFGSQINQWMNLVLMDDHVSILSRSHVHGVYRHERRELIAADANIALRHELVHMLHQRHMDALGQQHPIWIQEGLAALWENETMLTGGASRFEIGERDAIAQNMLANDRLMPWKHLFALNEVEFQREAHRTYAQAHSVLRFVACQRDLAEWYRLYISGFDNDSSGMAALEELFEQPLNEIEISWKQWLRKQPIVIDHRALRAKLPMH